MYRVGTQGKVGIHVTLWKSEKCKLFGLKNEIVAKQLYRWRREGGGNEGSYGWNILIYSRQGVNGGQKGDHGNAGPWQPWSSCPGGRLVCRPLVLEIRITNAAG